MPRVTFESMFGSSKKDNKMVNSQKLARIQFRHKKGREREIEKKKNRKSPKKMK